MRVTAGSVAKRLKEVGYAQFDKELDMLAGIKTRPNGSRYLDPKAERFITAESHSWSEIGEAVCGREFMTKMRDAPYGMRGGHANSHFIAMEDSPGGAMGPSQFAAINYWSGITFKVLEAELLSKFNDPDMIGGLVTTLKPGVITNNARRGRYSPPTESVGRRLQPNEPLPAGSMDAEWIDVNPVYKNGQHLSIASETMLFDGNQGAAVSAIGDIGYQIAWNKEDKILKPLFGIENTYKYGTADNEASTAYNTYNSATPSGITWKNSLTATDLVDETNLDSAEQLLMAMNHPRTGYPINVSKRRQMVVTPFKKMTAIRLSRVTTVQTGPREASPQAVMVTEPTYAGQILEVLISQRAMQLMQQSFSDPETSNWTALTAAQAKYRVIYGDPAKAFEYREVRPFQSWSWNMTQDPSLALRDTFMMVAALEQGSVTITEPRHVLRFEKDS